MTRQHIIQRIRDYAAQTGLAPATVTGRAVGNSRLYDRLSHGGDCTTEIAAKLFSYMDNHPPKAGVVGKDTA